MMYDPGSICLLDKDAGAFETWLPVAASSLGPLFSFFLNESEYSLK